MQVTQDGRYLTTSSGNNVQLWDGASFAPVKTFKMGFNVESAAFCPKRGRIAAGGSDMWPRLFDADTGAELGAWADPFLPHHCVVKRSPLSFLLQASQYINSKEESHWMHAWCLLFIAHTCISRQRYCDVLLGDNSVNLNPFPFRATAISADA